MNIEILQLIEGSKKAEGITVIIDVFRAFSLEAYLMAAGAEKIIPVGSKEVAYKLKEKYPDMILAGERHGKILPGFDMGNSPSQLNEVSVMGKTVIHTTSAGTQGIANANKADEILGASFLTAKATAEYIKKKNPKKVSLVCMGLEAKKETEEDTLCAEYIRSLLLGEEMHLDTEINSLKHTSGAKFFDKEQNTVFPENDFYMCTEVNKFDFILRLKREQTVLPYMEKIYMKK